MTSATMKCVYMLVLITLLLSGCGGGGGSSSTSNTTTGGGTGTGGSGGGGTGAGAVGLVSVRNPLSSACSAGQNGTLFTNAEVEPSMAVNPRDPNQWVGAWQQDRWSNGGAAGVVSAYSNDAGTTWTVTTVPFSTCTGGTLANRGNFDRATDPWVTYSPSGTVYQMALGFSGTTFEPGSRSAMLVSRSLDNGRTWSPVTTLIEDGAAAFNDKNSMTADPVVGNNAYAVWDRLNVQGNGPTWFSRTLDNGLTWEAARNIYDPGPFSQTIGNLIAVTPSGVLVNVFTQYDPIAGGAVRGTLNVIRSTNQGTTWSAPIRVADLLTIGTRDPDTGSNVRDGAGVPSIAAAPNGDLYVVWQDARFSNGVRDAIALSKSTDGGLTWSVPARISSSTTVAAFMPTVAVRADGTVGVSYFDFRSNTPDPASLLTDYWLASSVSGVVWTESKIGSTFDLAVAPPTSRGYFIGDYMSLAAAGTRFVPFYVRTSNNDLTNRTDVYALPLAGVTPGVVEKSYSAASAPTEISAELRKKASDHALGVVARKVPGWKHPMPASLRLRK